MNDTFVPINVLINFAIARSRRNPKMKSTSCPRDAQLPFPVSRKIRSVYDFCGEWILWKKLLTFVQERIEVGVNNEQLLPIIVMTHATIFEGCHMASPLHFDFWGAIHFLS